MHPSDLKADIYVRIVSAEESRRQDFRVHFADKMRMYCGRIMYIHPNMLSTIAGHCIRIIDRHGDWVFTPDMLTLVPESEITNDMEIVPIKEGNIYAGEYPPKPTSTWSFSTYPIG